MNLSSSIPMSASKPVKTIFEILGREPGSSALFGASKEAPPMSELPVAGDVGEVREPQGAAYESATQPIVVDFTRARGGTRNFLRKDLVRYPLIFLVAFGFFYVILNFKAVSQQVKNTITPPPKQEKVVLASNLADYNLWIKKYYVQENDAQKLDPNADPDQDGLTNLDEFYLGTNPFNPDTNRNGYMDGEEILAGYNPLYIGKATPEQESILNNKLDKAAIAQRTNFEQARGSGVAGATLDVRNGNDQPAQPVSFTVDISRQGLVEIPKLGVSAPLVWNTDFSKVQDDLKFGVVHHPATPLPGEPGMVSIHGHSSGFPWDGDYKTAFTKLNFLEAGDEAFVTVYGIDGTNRRYRYVVESKKIFEKDDPDQFVPPGSGSYLNLSTSWPVGTAQKRYVVTTKLAGI